MSKSSYNHGIVRKHVFLSVAEINKETKRPTRFRIANKQGKVLCCPSNGLSV